MSYGLCMRVVVTSGLCVLLAGSLSAGTASAADQSATAAAQAAQARKPLRVYQSERRVSDDGKRARVVLSLEGAQASDAAGMRLWLSVAKRRIARVRLAPRLRRAGFVLNLRRARQKATIVVSPPARLPLPVFGEGKLLIVKVPVKAGELSVDRSEFGSRKGMPL
jgi:hypothetical protein